MKNAGNIALVLCILIIIVIAYEHIDRSGRKKTGVVQLQELVYEFKGMKNATKKYTEKINKWSAESDSMENKLRHLLDDMKLDSINNDKVKRQKDKERFYLLQKSYYEYRQKTEQKAQQEDKEMTQGVMNQINEYIKAFAEQNNYDVIFANTEMQNVSYVSESTDITKKVLEFANKKYEGE